MKRYEFIREIDGSCIEEDPQGEWVKYEDVKGIEKIGFGRVHCALCGADLSKGNHQPTCELIRCNCEEESEKDPDFYHHWICPAHGFKFHLPEFS